MHAADIMGPARDPAACMQWTINSLWLLKYEAVLTHWGRVTHIWVDKLTVTGSDNGLSPDRRQAIIWTNAGIL